MTPAEPVPRIDADIALVLCDDTGMIVAWSDAAAALFGHDAFAVLGRYFDVIVPDGCTDAAWTRFGAALTGDAELDGRVLHLPVACAGGAVGVFLARLAVLRDPTGAPCAAAATFTGPVDAPAFTSPG